MPATDRPETFIWIAIIVLLWMVNRENFDFLKGGTMKIQFNEAQLSRPQQESLIKVLDVLQAKNENELEVTAVEFPKKLMVKLDDDIEMLFGWDADKKSYAGITEPESPNEPKAGAIKSFELPESQKDTVDLPEPEHGTHILSDERPKPEPERHIDVDPIKLAALKYELMSTHLNMPVEKKIIFNKEYARLWSEHK